MHTHVNKYSAAWDMALSRLHTELHGEGTREEMLTLGRDRPWHTSSCATMRCHHGDSADSEKGKQIWRRGSRSGKGEADPAKGKQIQQVVLKGSARWRQGQGRGGFTEIPSAKWHQR